MAAKTTQPRFGTWSWIRTYTPKMLRLTAFLAFAYVVALLLLGHQARAQVSERLMSIGVEMLRYEDAEHQQPPRTLRLNGQPIKLASGIARHPLGRVLDFYQAKCLERGGQLGAQMRELVSGHPEIAEVDESLLDPTMREEEGNKGYVACLETGSGRLEPEDLLERFERFRQSMDLSDIGELRYIYAEESEGTTMFVAFWTEGTFRILDLFPAEGDAAGRDPDDVPRPPEGRRILSAYEEGQPESVTMYMDSPRGADGLESFYRNAMPSRGWHLLELDAATLRRRGIERPEHALVYERGDQMVSLVFQDSERNMGITTVLTNR